MNKESIPSVLLSGAVNEFNKLPGIGSKTALRLVLHLLNQSDSDVKLFTHAISELKEQVKFCKICNNISDSEVCAICSNHNRDENTICLVESIRDVMAIENTLQYRGFYHVLGGVISPIDGVGPQDLSIDLLLQRLNSDKEYELIFALPATMEGDTTCYYIHKKTQNFNVKYSILSRGIAIGNEIEYADELTLGRSIKNRTPFESAGV